MEHNKISECPQAQTGSVLLKRNYTFLFLRSYFGFLRSPFGFLKTLFRILGALFKFLILKGIILIFKALLTFKNQRNLLKTTIIQFFLCNKIFYTKGESSFFYWEARRVLMFCTRGYFVNKKSDNLQYPFGYVRGNWKFNILVAFFAHEIIF